jgi:hypothetical protein
MRRIAPFPEHDESIDLRVTDLFWFDCIRMGAALRAIARRG